MSAAEETTMIAAEHDLLKRLEPVLATGWCVTGPDLRGGLKVERDWTADHSSVSDAIDIRRGSGLAQGIRRREDKDGRRRQWVQQGSLADVVDGFLALPDPEGHQLDEPFMPLGANTARANVFFHLRVGWDDAFPDTNGLNFSYRLGVGAEELERPRLEQHEYFGIEPLSCTVTPDLEVQITPWQVINGCPTHNRNETRRVEFDDPAFRAILEEYEFSSRKTDLRTLAYCLAFGPCSMRDPSFPRLDHSEDHPGDEKVTSALASLDADRWSIQPDPEGGHTAVRRWPNGTIDLLSITSPSRTYALRTDAESWVLWKGVGSVDGITKAFRDLPPPDEWGAPTERLFRMTPEDQDLLSAIDGGARVNS